METFSFLSFLEWFQHTVLIIKMVYNMICGKLLFVRDGFLAPALLLRDLKEQSLYP